MKRYDADTLKGKIEYIPSIQYAAAFTGCGIAERR